LNLAATLDRITDIALEAGVEILRHYGRVAATTKADHSPLTEADLASHRLICSRLQALTPALPVLSEESEAQDPSARARWSEFWLVDPLDGTKEFLKQSGEFTVNIALVRDGRPVLGVVYAPVLRRIYRGGDGLGAWRQESDGAPVPVRARRAEGSRLTIVASRDHAGPQVAELLARFPQARTSSMGSSLKFCLVAEGSADIYLRDLPTMEWDTGAAQCVVEAAGGAVRDLDGRPLQYNKPDLRNPAFVVLGDPGFNWSSSSPLPIA
jgi:3'(2'), 5'-bisphosphate nucleotidase